MGIVTRREVTTRASCAAAALSLGLTLASMRQAHAAPAIPTRLVWHGAVCGTAQDFAARVAQRTTMVRFVRRGQRLAVRLRIQRQGSGLDASVSIEARGKAPMIRHIESPDCEDALDALALVVAIGVEARAADAPVSPRPRRRAPGPRPPTVETSGSPEPPSPAPPEPAPELGPAPPSEQDAPVTTSESPAATSEPPPAETAPVVAPPPPVVALEPTLVPAAPSPTPASDAPRAPSESAARADSIDVSAGLAAQVSVGVAPDPMLGGGVWLSAGWDDGGVWSPELSLRAVHQRLDGFRSERGAVDFSSNTLALALCPLRWGSDNLSVRPCVAGELGRLAARAYDTFDPRSTAELWSALGTSIDGIARAGILEFRAQLGVGAPLSRDKYGFGTGCAGAACEADVFHRVEPVIWSGALGAGVRVW